MPESLLHLGERRALVGFHMGPQSGAGVRGRHGRQIVLEGVGFNDESRGRQVVDVHVPTERLELSLAAS